MRKKQSQARKPTDESLTAVAALDLAEERRKHASAVVDEFESRFGIDAVVVDRWKDLVAFWRIVLSLACAVSFCAGFAARALVLGWPS